jgi:ATP-dependent Clp protease ATP-binding subunit ClpA
MPFVARALGLSDPRKPDGSFFVPRPDGCRERPNLPRHWSGFLFDSDDHLIRLDMSEFSGEARCGPAH